MPWGGPGEVKPIYSARSCGHWVLTPAALGPGVNPQDTSPRSNAGVHTLACPLRAMATSAAPLGFLPKPASHLGQQTHVDLDTVPHAWSCPSNCPGLRFSRQCGVPQGVLHGGTQQKAADVWAGPRLG